MRTAVSPSVTVLTACLIAGAAGAQESSRRIVSGLVRDSVGTPIPFAVVQGNANTKVAADDSGRFSLRIGAGTALHLDIRRIGFQPVVLSVPPGRDTLLQVVMTPLARRLSTVEVLASHSRSLELRGFYRRMADRERGIINGEFITTEEIERRNPPRVTFMMDLVQGVRVKKVGFGPLSYEVLGSDGCVMTVYLDGIRLNRLDQRRNTLKDFVDEIVAPTSVAGIEVYRSAGRAPPEYQSLAGACGVVLIWTK